MDKIFYALTLIITFFNTQVHNIPNNNIPPQIPSHIVCVDPGHGGEDSGALNNELIEKNITLDIAQRLKQMLEQNNYRVIMTRENNETFLTNSERAKICNANKAEILISIHLNSNEDNSLDYTEGLYGMEAKDKEFADYMQNQVVIPLNTGNGGTTDFKNNMLIKANMPAALQEVAFISSDVEYKLLSDGSGQRQEQIAKALFQGINNWFFKK